MGYLLLHSGQPTARRILQRITNLTGVESMDPVTSQDKVIRWGNTEDTDTIPELVLNKRTAILATRSRQEMLTILRLNGIRCPVSPETGAEKIVSLSRHYRVPVCNMEALALYRADGKAIWLDRRISRINQHFREVPLDEDRYAIRTVRLAVRAVHALGLDFGLVSIGISTRGLAIVLDVSPAPVLKDRLADLYSDAITKWMDNEDTDAPASFMMGTDLEFMLRNRDGKMVLASKYLRRNGTVGCDALSIRRDGKRFPLAEIRPEPQSSPLQLVKNIEASLQEAKRLLPRTVQWIAGSMPFRNFGIGGHIHFSDLPLSSRLVRALDTYLALPVLMLEDETTAAKRRPKYGFLGDIRIKSHGGWEYRTLGSWIVSPEIAKAVLCLAYIVAANFRELNNTYLVRPDLQRAFYRGEKEKLRSYFNKVWDEIQQLPDYFTYEDELAVIGDMVERRERWDEQHDIKPAWNILYGSPLRTKN